MEWIDRSQRGTGWEELQMVSQRTYMYICIAHGHRQQCGAGLRDICNSFSNQKIFLNKKFS